MLAHFLTIRIADDPISTYRHWKSFNANGSNFKRLCRYYEARAEDRSIVTFQFRQTGRVIHIFLHRRLPNQEFQALLARFFQGRSDKNVVSNEDVEIRADDFGESQASDRVDQHNMHPGYKGLNANGTNFRRLCRFSFARLV